MKKILVLIGILVIVSCSKEQSILQNTSSNSSFSAMIEDASTKVALNADENAILWQVGDKIEIYDGTNKKEYITSSSGKSATFTPVSGDVSSGCAYHAIFPSSILSDIDASLHKFTVTLPSEQSYNSSSLIDTDAMPMVSYISSGTAFNFKNAGGIIKINLTTDNPNVKVKSITLTSDEYMSGKATITWSNNPTVDWVAAEASKQIKLICETPVAISSTSTPFYFVVPAGTYTSLKITIETDFFDVSQILTSKTNIDVARSSKTTFNVNANKIQKDLSETEKSNCYLVTKLSGKYIFDASHKGNSNADADAITGALSAKVLWETFNTSVKPEKGSVIPECTYDATSKFITFMTNGVKGNALIALYDGLNGTGNILWSWHIWICDDICDEKYANSSSSVYLMDRNLGALSANPTDGSLTSGFFYQSGRKDPFSGSTMTASMDGFHMTKDFATIDMSEETGTIDYTVLHPDVFIKSSGDWQYSGSQDYWVSDLGCDEKTKYDPCPVGYKTINTNSYTSFWNFYKFGAYNEDLEEKYIHFNGDATNKGRHYSYDTYGGTSNSWYPATGYRQGSHGYIVNSTDWLIYYSAKRSYSISVGTIAQSGLNVAYSFGRANGCTTRCQKM